MSTTRHPPIYAVSKANGNVTWREEKMTTYLVLVGCSHGLDDLFTLGFADTTSLSNDLGQDSVDLTSHASSVTADVEEGLLGQELVDLGAALLETVLDVDLFGCFTGKGSDNFKLVTKDLLVFLSIMLVKIHNWLEVALISRRTSHSGW